MASKIKDVVFNNKVSLHQSKSEPHCRQWKEDILIEFGHITQIKEHSYDSLVNAGKTDMNAIKSLMDLITKMSTSSWEELQRRSKHTIGGFETMEAGNMNKRIWDKYYPSMSEDTKLYIFRFGNKDKYRMVGYKSRNCSRVLHILGFDVDFTLYDHG